MFLHKKRQTAEPIGLMFSVATHMTPRKAFGELALLYNAPRAASIICKTKCVLFKLDRDTFNNIVKDVFYIN